MSKRIIQLLPKECPGIAWQNKAHYLRDLDLEIRPLVLALNRLEYLHTTASCAGHSLKEINNAYRHPELGRSGWYVNVPYRITLTFHVNSGDEHIRSFVLLMKRMSDVCGKAHFRCELGYQEMTSGENMNYITEPGFVPFEVSIYAETKKQRDHILIGLLKIMK